MTREQFQVYLQINLSNHMTEMTIVEPDDNMVSYDLSLDECLTQVIELESRKKTTV